MNSDLQYIGERIRTERKAQNMSQECLAEDAKISTTTIRNIENGSTDMKISTFMEIVAELKVSPLALLPERFSENDNMGEWTYKLSNRLSHLSEKKRREVQALINGILSLC